VGRFNLSFLTFPKTSLFHSYQGTLIIFLLGIERLMNIYDFVEKFLAFHGDVLLFHMNDLRVLKEVRSYMKNYDLQIWMKWAMVNLLPLTNSEDPSFKVPSQSHKLSLY